MKDRNSKDLTEAEEHWRLSPEELMLPICGAGEDSWESLELNEIKPVSHKGNQPWIFIGRTDAEAETPILWPPDVKSQLIGKDRDAGKDWRKKEKGAAEEEVVREQHQLSGHELEQTPGDSGGQRSLAFCRPWGRKDWHDLETEQHNHTKSAYLKPKI